MSEALAVDDLHTDPTLTDAERRVLAGMELHEGDGLSPEDAATFAALTSGEHMSHDGLDPTFSGYATNAYHGSTGSEATPTATQPPASEGEEYKFDTKNFGIHTADLTHGLEGESRDYAAEKVNRSIERPKDTSWQDAEGLAKAKELTVEMGRRAKNFIVGKVWRGNIARDYYLLKNQQEGTRRLTEGGPVNGNISVLHDGSQAESDQTKAAVIDRVAGGYLHGEAQSEMQEVAGGDGLQTRLRELVKQYATGDLDEESLLQERTRALESFGKDLNDADRRKGLALADNVMEVARHAKAAIDHGIGLERIDEALKFSHTEAKMGARTESRANMAERAMHVLNRSKFGLLANETVVAAVASAPFIAGKFAARKATSAALHSLLPGAGAAVTAGVREWQHVKQERVVHMREMAQGGGELLSHAGKRRERLEATRYRTVSVTELMDDLAGAGELDGADSNAMRRLLDGIVHAETRIRLSDQKNIDLISYSSKGALLEGERTALDRRVDEARAAVRVALAGADESVLSTAGATAEDGSVIRDLDTILALRSAAVLEGVNTDMSAKDHAFNVWRAKRVVGAGATALVGGALLGLAAQEVKGAVDGNLQGAFESFKGQAHETPLAHMLHGAHEHTQAIGASSHASETALTGVNQHTYVNVPNGYHLAEAHGKWELISSHNQVIDGNMTFDAQGHMTEATRKALTAKGFRFTDYTYSDRYPTGFEQTLVERTPQGYVDAHPGQFVHVDHDLWYDDNSPTTSVGNALRMDWGGVNGTGMDAHGNYVFSMSSMTPDGSFHDGLSANAQELIREGKMRVALSMTQGTQTHVIMVPVNEQGQAVISRDSFAGKLLFTHHDGQAQFHGAYAETVQLAGAHHGVEQIRTLATVVGEGKVNTVPDHIQHLVYETHEQTITTLTPPAEAGVPQLIEVPPSYPIRARGGLEYADPTNDESLNFGGYLNYVGEVERHLSPAERASLAPYAPELIDNPDANLDAAEVFRRYRRDMRPSYVHTLGELTEQLEGQPKAANPRVTVLIPAAAHQEGDNIYNTLEQYAQQQDVSEDEFEIVVFANSPESEKFDGTIDEIKRFQREHPGIAVRYMARKLKQPEANIGWIRKALTDSMLDEYDRRGVDLNNVIFVSNDADSERIDPAYLSTVINRAERAPETDGFLGFIDWGHAAYDARPELLVGTRFMQMLDIHSRVIDKQIGSSGANFGFRPSMYMAVGGYQGDRSVAEDVALGRAMKAVRSGSGRQPIRFLGRTSQIMTSPRRALEKLEKDGGAPAAQWADEFSPNDALRTKKYELTPFDFNDAEAVEEMVGSCERMINQTMRIYGITSTDDDEQSVSTTTGYLDTRLSRMDGALVRQLDRFFWFLGIQADWQPDGSIRIAEHAQLIENLRNWRAKNITA